MENPYSLLRFSKEDLQKARETVADWYINNAHEIRSADNYAAHVTEEKKIEIFYDSLKNAEMVRAGEKDHNFAVWQRIYQELTGECVGFLAK